MLRELIIEKRKLKQLSLAALAEKVGVRIATLSDYETGKSAISADTIEKIFEVLEISLKSDDVYKQNIWDESKKCAVILSEKNVNINKMTKQEIFDMTGIEIVLALKQISEALYDEYALKRLINEDETLNYFKTLVEFHTAFIKKANQE